MILHSHLLVDLDLSKLCQPCFSSVNLTLTHVYVCEYVCVCGSYVDQCVCGSYGEQCVCCLRALFPLQGQMLL